MQLMLMLSFTSPLPFPLLFTNFFSFLPFFPISLVPSLPFLYYSDTSPHVPLYLGLVSRDFFPSLNYSVLNFSLFSLRFFLCPSVRTHYYVPLSPGPTRRNLPWSKTGPWKLLSPFFLYLLPVVVLIFTHLFFVVVSYLLPRPCPSPSHSVRCTPALRLVFLPCYRSGLRLHPPRLVSFQIIIY